MISCVVCLLPRTLGHYVVCLAECLRDSWHAHVLIRYFIKPCSLLTNISHVARLFSFLLTGKLDMDRRFSSSVSELGRWWTEQLSCKQYKLCRGHHLPKCSVRTGVEWYQLLWHKAFPVRTEYVSWSRILFFATFDNELLERPTPSQPSVQTTIILM